MKPALGLMIMGALAGCARQAAPASSASRAASGEPRLELPAGLVEPRGTLVIGEMHGTRELPAFTARVVETVAASQPIVLALEIARDAVPSLPAYLASDGGSAARAALLRDPFWLEPYTTGQSSVAMLELIDTARRLRANGARVEVACFDAGNAQPREQAMADNLLAVRRAHPDAVLIVLTGNLHARKRPLANRPGVEWMAQRLGSAGGKLVSITPRYPTGSAWVCMGTTPADCGPQQITGDGDRAERGVALEASADGAFDGRYSVGPITPSPPAAFPELAAQIDQLAATFRERNERRAAAVRAYDAKQYER